MTVRPHRFVGTNVEHAAKRASWSVLRSNQNSSFATAFAISSQPPLVLRGTVPIRFKEKESVSLAELGPLQQAVEETLGIGCHGRSL